MHEIFALNDQPPLSVAVHELWVVEADQSYSRHELKRLDSTRLLLLRTCSGCGLVRLMGEKELVLPEGSLLVCPLSEVHMYTCGAEKWDFIWCVFSMAFPEPIRMREVILHPEAGADMEAARRAVAHFSGGGAAGQLLGTAEFLNILGHCLPALCLRRPAADTLAQRTAEFLRQSLTRPLCARDIALHMGVNERTLRRAFAQMYRTTPIRFLHEQRLIASVRWLRESSLSLEQIAEMFCFSSPYHFSRAYKAHFGLPPADERRQAHG